eukprot:CAMPEP_0117452620 /NCGR_PEP_ID=MMETSP0759-20121206/9726_1 /TAXON_ID=63605 /ORGANISM="Percolomonas cosmopolitus, Strain WS" /LENGTH=420 /DNA_ID=CAMNT_0005245475 /DNA_START=132 /DNA_END=1394 /DNA_ORIENTATION=-
MSRQSQFSTPKSMAPHLNPQQQQLQQQYLQQQLQQQMHAQQQINPMMAQQMQHHQMGAPSSVSSASTSSAHHSAPNGTGAQQGGQKPQAPTYINRPDNFASLVSQIQFIHGDAEKPQENTVRVIEQYVRQKMMKMIIRARENMFRRMDLVTHESLGGAVHHQALTAQQIQQQNRLQFQLSLDDFTFLNRHRLEKLTRLHTYLSIKRHEAREKEKQTFNLDINRCLHQSNLSRLERMLTNTENDYPSEDPKDKPPRNMFLIRDNVDDRRAKAAKQLVRDMNQSEFNQYSKCGSAVFKFSQNPKKFVHWLRIDKIRYEMQQDLLECLSYLAYEMVALVTQVSLLVKRNMLNREDDTSKTISIVTGVLDNAWKSKLSTVHLEHDDSYEKAPSTRRPIQPGHVFEAIRRLEARDELFAKHNEFL